ncbi:MAG TPA: GntR family transcriptional regulator [Frankiaceae bacterium]|jgi:GntR family transcriptional regulator|nr:GntR family transcriptional regulator [Frankiaceae bacterium]
MRPESERPEPGFPKPRRSRDSARRIRDLIRAEMHRGAYADGMLPSEELLMRQMHASRSAIRGAFALLREEGLIDRIQGIGTVVVAELKMMTLEESQGVAPFEPSNPLAVSRPRILAHDEIELPPPISRHLGVAARSPGIRIEYLPMFNSVPLGIVTNYLRMPEAASLAKARFTTDYYRYLADAGLDTTETSYLMEAAVADDTDAALLGLQSGDALMVAEQTLLNEKGEAFNYAFVRARGDMSALLSRAGRASTHAPNGEPPADRS